MHKWFRPRFFIALCCAVALASCSGKKRFSALDEDKDGKRITSSQSDALSIPPDFNSPPPKN